jgi:hypothetical protein
MMNAETSAVGRACGMLGIGLNTSVASLDEVRARKRETDDDAAARYHSSPVVSRSEAPAVNFWAWYAVWDIDWLLAPVTEA